MKLANGKSKAVPKCTYPYKSLIVSVRHFLSQENIKKFILQWKERVVPNDILADVYDGNV